jgi:UDP-GlcNAc:undecaprenyl-phosphate/decaprenyl-phosphate GlcNAc-1-phosphate transferase
VLTYILIFAAALSFALGGTPMVRRLALATGLVDHPDSRKMHRVVVPLLGGVAIYGASVIALLLFADRFYVAQSLSILVGASLVSFLGIWDDRSGLRPVAKLIGQVAAALIPVVSGIRVEVIRDYWFVGILPSDTTGLVASLANVFLSIVWFVAITNSLNLLDNMDGLSSGVAAVAAAFFLLLAIFNGQFLVATLAAAILGACLGFLYYNFNPAKIFMGDSGSLFLGYALAALGIKLRFDNADIVTWMVPVMVLGIAIFDTTLVVISRLRRGLNPFTTPGKDHLSHRLVALGWTQREAVMLLYLVCGMLGMAAMFITKATILEGYLVGGVVVFAAIAVLIRLVSVPLPDITCDDA